MCYAGIPLCYRGAIWNLLCGNSLQITSDLYKIFKHRAMKLSSVSKSRYADGPPQESFVNNTKFEEECRCIDEDLEAGPMQGKEESMTIIRYDIPRTFAEIHVGIMSTMCILIVILLMSPGFSQRQSFGN